MPTPKPKPVEFPPASVDDAWLAVAGVPNAHLFPVGSTVCACLRHPRSGSGPVASCMTDARNRGEGKVYRPYCRECLAIQGERWSAAYPSRGTNKVPEAKP